MIAFQLLSCRVEIEHDDPGLARAFDYLANCARQPDIVRVVFRYQVDGFSPYQVREEGDLAASVATPEDVLYVVFQRVHRRVLERFALAGWTVYHAALAEIRSRRILLLGDKGSGKTTLALRLLYAGHRVDGDEYALERGGQVVQLPRLLHLKPGVERLVPELAEHLTSLPRIRMGDGEVLAADPTRLGFDWRIDVGPVDGVVLIAPNHGGETSLTRLQPFEAIRYLLAGSLRWGETRSALVASAARLGRAGGWRLRLGDPWVGIRTLEGALAPAVEGASGGG